MKDRSILVGVLVGLGGCGVLVSISVAILAGAVVYISTQDFGFMDEPAILSELGVHLEDVPFRKAEIFSDGVLARVTDIQIGDYLDDAGLEIAVVSSEGAAFANMEWKTLRTVPFASGFDRVTLVEMPNSDGFRFVSQGSWVEDAAFVGSDGATIWAYDAMMGVNDMAAGDLDSDGVLDFVVGTNGFGGLHRVDIDGKRVWKRRGGNLWQVAIVDIDGAGSMRIVHSNAEGQMVIRDGRGKILKRVGTRGYFSSFSLCAWPDSAGIQYPFYAADDSAYILDYDGSTLVQLDTPDCGSLAEAYGTTVRFVADQEPYIACIVDYELSDTGILYICDSTGTLVYQEVMPESCAAIAAIPEGDGASEYLVVGGTRAVWSYRWGGDELN